MHETYHKNYIVQSNPMPCFNLPTKHNLNVSSLFDLWRYESLNWSDYLWRNTFFKKLMTTIMVKCKKLLIISSLNILRHEKCRVSGNCHNDTLNNSLVNFYLLFFFQINALTVSLSRFCFCLFVYVSVS